MTTDREALTLRPSDRALFELLRISADEHAAEVVLWPALTFDLSGSTSTSGPLSIGFERPVRAQSGKTAFQ